ncbi:MAG: type II toxin-antitoxin system HicB family antitoxin [Geminicoccaceae bacterium]
MAVRHYRAFLHRGDDGAFGVVFPEFPGCVTCGDTASAALEAAAEAIALHVEDMGDCPNPPISARPFPTGATRRTW